MTIAPTWALSARPLPETAAFTSLGVYVATGSPRRAAATSAIPLAWAVPMMVLESDRAKTRSTATASGAYSSSHASMPRSIVTSRCAIGRSADVRTHVDVDQPQRPADLALDDAEAAPGQPRVDAEHAHAVLLPVGRPNVCSCAHASRRAGPIAARHAGVRVSARPAARPTRRTSRPVSSSVR